MGNVKHRQLRTLTFITHDLRGQKIGHKTMGQAGAEKQHLDLEKDLSSLQLVAHRSVLEEKKTGET